MITHTEANEISDRVFELLNKYGRVNTVLTAKEANEIITSKILDIIIEVANGSDQTPPS